MSGLIVNSGSFNRIYVKPINTSLGSVAGSKIKEYLTHSRDFPHLVQLPCTVITSKPANDVEPHLQLKRQIAKIVDSR